MITPNQTPSASEGDSLRLTSPETQDDCVLIDNINIVHGKQATTRTVWHVHILDIQIMC